MTHLNKLQTIKIICPSCGQKHLKTVDWLSQNKSIGCGCGIETPFSEIETLVEQAIKELK
ncbi:hypothetical protein [Psychrobium sp. 1_MG-2023]|uniref:hypothetical protein n=1 Tax=Psychrobium sp. 1_MG-2023 TaxID=3062624 RepID=UPI000C34CE7E|nr:hypothetical protein [Psychrobium sp. 1_MG-2023]MDP2560000.1 hypothetical protein [Psychrobium sp. 1_MG-2023]PKF56338.1 hypothetical protein CW748_10285 [Alteromonadales bacterium alter-6D02]